MRKSRFSEEQIIGILKQAEAGVAVSELCRQNAISDATFYKWRSKFGGLEVAARRLDALRLQGQCPQVIRVDNGPEFTSKALDRWAHEHGVRLEFIRPGKPTDNCFIESFNGRFRDECLDANLFTNLSEAKKVIEEWRQDYNTLRPHGSLGGMSPDAYRRASTGENLNNQSPNLSVVYPEG